MTDKLITAWVSQILNGSFSRSQIIQKKFNVTFKKYLYFCAFFPKQIVLKRVSKIICMLCYFRYPS